MCRNIKPLFNFEPPASEEEIRQAAMQFVRKISGFNKPSKANEAAFLAAVDEIAAASARLLRSLETQTAPKDRAEEAARKRARSAPRARSDWQPQTLARPKTSARLSTMITEIFRIRSSWGSIPLKFLRL